MPHPGPRGLETRVCEGAWGGEGALWQADPHTLSPGPPGGSQVTRSQGLSGQATGPSWSHPTPASAALGLTLRHLSDGETEAQWAQQGGRGGHHSLCSPDRSLTRKNWPRSLAHQQERRVPWAAPGPHLEEQPTRHGASAPATGPHAGSWRGREQPACPRALGSTGLGVPGCDANLPGAQPGSCQLTSPHGRTPRREQLPWAGRAGCRRLSTAAAASQVPRRALLAAGCPGGGGGRSFLKGLVQGRVWPVTLCPFLYRAADGGSWTGSPPALGYQGPAQGLVLGRAGTASTPHTAQLTGADSTFQKPPEPH